MMRSRFEPDVAASVGTPPSAALFDPDAYDASEQQFAASLEEHPQLRFVVDDASAAEIARGSASGVERQEANVSSEPPCPLGATTENRILPAEEDAEDATGEIYPQTIALAEETTTPPENTESWRQEVQTRVNSYRARRRPRGPRYPSLRLKFEADQPTKNAIMATQSAAPIAPRTAVGVARPATTPSQETSAQAPAAAAMVYLSSAPMAAGETTAEIIEFPRSSVVFPNRLDELAEPVLDRPRILEAPELVPLPPALGGILIEPPEPQESEKRPGFEMPLQSAPMSQRLVAVAIDTLLVLSSVALFAYIFWRMAKEAPPLQHAIAGAMALTGILWAAYHYLLLVYCGITPGLKLAKLRLSRFDGSPVVRRVRRWRVLASVLSGVSLGLGYAWCFLDEDQLCWHDRITRTYIAPKT
jgi:uncharacterized RDD family membrane protein YckC